MATENLIIEFSELSYYLFLIGKKRDIYTPKNIYPLNQLILMVNHIKRRGGGSNSHPFHSNTTEYNFSF